MEDYILHGTWLKQGINDSGYFILWAEERIYDLESVKPKGRQAKIPKHPYSADSDAIEKALKDLAWSLFLDDFDPKILKGEAILKLPIAGKLPLPSYQTSTDFGDKISISECKADIICLELLDAIKFLSSIPIHAYDLPYEIGSDISFWSVSAKFVLHLISQHKFMPMLYEDGDGFLAIWEAILDDMSDAEKLNKLATSMPDACRSVKSVVISKDKHEQPESYPQEFVLDFIKTGVDKWVRSNAGNILKLNDIKKIKDTIIVQWLNGLLAENGKFKAPKVTQSMKGFCKTLADWRSAGIAKGAMTEKFRPCFRLEPPEEEDSSWMLRYFLQANDDPSLLVPADLVWKERKAKLKYLNRELESPQEQMLTGLGVASRIFPPIERSLRQKRPEDSDLNVEEAYQFLSESSVLLQQSGFGVLAPPWWTDKRSQLKAKVSFSKTRTESTGILSLDSVLSYDWQMALGDDIITPEELEQLAKLKIPIVQMRGQWILLRPEDIKSAMEFVKKHGESGEVTLRDAVKMSLSESPQLEGIRIEGIETPKWLGTFIDELKGGIKPIDQPKEFIGQLRPYQLVGLSWLAFMRQYGLGACLADDMGLGKCLSGDSLVFVNGSLVEAEKIWSQYSTEPKFAGEGFWATPNETLTTNSIDEETGKIVQSNIKRLYRQKIDEKMRIIRLEDGSNITITRSHKLLTSKGWTNELNVGDYVCVPAKAVWEGKEEDPDLIKFLAWQIAEGYETKNATLHRLQITQKDVSILEDLLQTIYRISDRYNLKINKPSIVKRSNKCPNLMINSRDFEAFVKNKGYSWGMSSRDKSIPEFILNSSIESSRLFLRNYFDAEASAILSMRSVEISTASKTIIHQLAYMLRRFGIWLRISPKQKRATNGSGIYRTYYIGVIGGNSARRFYQEIGFSSCDKQRKLEIICNQVNNTNIEGVPASDVVSQIVERTGLPIRHLGMHNTVYINGTQQFSHKSLEKVICAISDVLSGEAERQYRLLKCSKWTSATLAVYDRLNRIELFAMKALLEKLLMQEVFYCKIKEIEEIDYDGWVYDFEIEKYHNFVANNILCHNTIEVIASLLNDKKQRKNKSVPNLLVCPTSVVGNWQREVTKFAPKLKVMIHHGSDRLSGKEFAESVMKHDLIVTSYGLTRRDAEDICAVNWKGVILDEAQNIKNPSSKIAQIACSLKSEYRYALTGTPVENRLMELWSIMQFLNPGYLGSQSRFNQSYVIPIERYGEESATKELRSIAAPFIMRRLKTDPKVISDLPEKMEMKVYCNLTREQVTLYEAVVKDMMQTLEDDTDENDMKRRGMILSGLMKLKQLCNHPALFLHDNSELDGRSGKLQRLVEILEEVIAEKDKALIFTQFTEMGESLRKYLSSKMKCDILYLHGGVAQKNRDKMVSAFQSDSNSAPIFIISIKAGGTGLNLTKANHVFHFDRWWNPAVEDQATDRAFRIGQKRNVQVHKFVCSGTLEEQIDQLIEKKKSLAQNIIGAGENWITELSNDELQKMITLRRDDAISADEG